MRLGYAYIEEHMCHVISTVIRETEGLFKLSLRKWKYLRNGALRIVAIDH